MSSVRLNDEDTIKLQELSQNSKIKKTVIVGYAIDHIIQYDMLNPDWIENLLESRWHDYLLSADVKYKKEFERDKAKSILKIQEMLIKKKIDVMPKEDATKFIDQMLGAKAAGDIIDRITSAKVFRVNNESTMLQPDADGKPRILGIPPSQIVKCVQGFHTAMDDCRSCRQRMTCETRRGFIIEWLGLHGTTKQQEQFIIDGRFATPEVKQLD